MAYFIFKSADTVNPFIIINEQTMDTTSSSIAYVGKRRVDYGESQQQNQLWLLENFAAATPPSNPTTGQLWYDTSEQMMKVYNGTTFIKIANSIAAPTGPTTPSIGQFWFNTTTNQLNVWNGSQWVVIGPDDSSLVFSIVFGG